MPWLRACLLGLALVAAARGDDLQTTAARAVDGLDSELAECTLLVNLCLGAIASVRPAYPVPPGADALATRQALLAEAHVAQTIATADAIVRKRGHRLPCFDWPECRVVLPRPPAAK